MKSGVLGWCLLFIASWSYATAPFDLIANGHAATALQALTLYTDSTFSQPGDYGLRAGQLVEVIGETELEHEDDAQNQTFKWFRVRTTNGREGWVFGDGLAVIVPEDRLEPAVKAHHKQKMHFNTGFETAFVWMASVEGHDNFHSGGLMNPVYFEGYIVITNQRGKSVHIYYTGESTQGQSDLQQMQFQELTGDSAPELILLNAYQPLGKQESYRQLELYSFQAGTINKVFEERLNLPLAQNSTSPCPFKFVELDDGTLRVEYVEVKNCTDYSLPLQTGLAGTSSAPQCLEYVTYTYYWDNIQKNYQLLYDESRSAPQVRLSQAGVVLQEAPNASARRLRAIGPKETVDVIREQVEWVEERGTQRRESYLYVRLAEGLYGYIPTRFTQFVQTAHAQQLDEYFRHPEQALNKEALSFFGIRGIPQDSSAFNN